MSTAPEEMHSAFPEWTFGDRLRKARRHAGLSQQELADAIEVSHQRYSNWETGYNLPRDLIGTADAVAKATGVDQGWLLGLEPLTRSRCSSPFGLVSTDAPVQGAFAFDRELVLAR